MLGLIADFVTFRPFEAEPAFDASARLEQVPLDILLGLAGELDEIDKSAEQSIQRANLRTFRIAREIANSLPRILSTASKAFAANEVSDQLRSTFLRISESWRDFRWRLATFVSFLHLAHQKGNEVEAYWNFIQGVARSFTSDLQHSSKS